MQRVTEFELLFRTKLSNFFLHDYFFIFNFQRELSGIKLAWNILSVRPGLIRQVSTCLIRLKSGLTCPFHHHNHYSNGKILILLMQSFTFWPWDIAFAVLFLVAYKKNCLKSVIRLIRKKKFQKLITVGVCLFQTLKYVSNLFGQNFVKVADGSGILLKFHSELQPEFR